MIGNIERRLCYDDNPNSIYDVPNNLTEEGKRLLDDIDNWLRESSTSSHLDPFAQAQAELPSHRKTEVPQLESANNITSHPIRPAKRKDRHKERKWCDFCLEFVTLPNISRHMHMHIYCNHCKKVHHSKSQQNLMYECPLFAWFWNATYISLCHCCRFRN